MKFAKRVPGLVGVFCLLVQLAPAQTDKKIFAARVDSMVANIMHSIPEIPGMTITIVTGNEPVFLKAYGWADKEAGVKATTATPFYIASATKSFTGLAAALLNKENKIKLDMPIQQYPPGIKFINEVASDKITVRDLLTHTSGLDNEALAFRVAYSGDINKQKLLEVLAGFTTTNKNYGKFVYTNLGYNIYALAIQQSLDKQWQDVLQEKIFTPLKMKRTTAYMSDVKKNQWQEAKPYDAYGVNGLTRVSLEKKDNTMQSAGGMVTTAEDLSIWLKAQMNNGLVDGKQVIPADVMELTHTGFAETEREMQPFTGKSSYGLGWYIGKYQNEKITYHFGGFPGYRSHISFMPDKKIGLAILVNESSIGSMAADLIATYAYNIWLHPEENDESYTKKIQSLLAAHENNKKGVASSYANLAQRQWQLSLPVENYSGVYSNAYFGSMEVYVQNNVPAVKMGNLNYVSTPFTKPETIRVELIPGSGRVIAFSKSEEGKVNKLVYDGIEFIRTK
jgi:CubicO group peptidase (beta-lactamase class C family)